MERETVVSRSISYLHPATPKIFILPPHSNGKIGILGFGFRRLPEKSIGIPRLFHERRHPDAKMANGVDRAFFCHQTGRNSPNP